MTDGAKLWGGFGLEFRVESSWGVEGRRREVLYGGFACVWVWAQW